MKEITKQRLERLFSVAKKRRFDLNLVIDNVDNAHNVSAILRTCDAFGVGRIDMVYPPERFPKLSDIVASSSLKWLNISKHNSLSRCIQKLKKDGFETYATTLDQKAQNYLDVEWSDKVAVVVGNESIGLSKNSLHALDHSIKIPMLGMVQSLNVSVATALVVAKVVLAKQNTVSNATKEGLTPPQKNLYDGWVLREQTKT